MLGLTVGVRVIGAKAGARLRIVGTTPSRARATCPGSALARGSSTCSAADWKGLSASDCEGTGDFDHMEFVVVRIEIDEGKVRSHWVIVA
jgi:hypothetical protein